MTDTVLAPCAACGALNRVLRAEARGRLEPRCGKCGAALPLHANVVAVDDRTLPHMLARADRPVVADFWAAWCAPCTSFAPVFEQASRQLSNLLFAKVDTGTSPAAAAHYAVRSIPTLIVFNHGVEQRRISGALPLPAFLAWLREAEGAGEARAM